MPNQFSRRSFLATTAGAGLLAMHPFAARAAANQAHLSIMETTDLHVHVFPYDYYRDRPADTVGLSRTAALINAVRAEAGNSMLIDNGDFLQGNPMGDYIAYERGMKDGDMHPIITAMNTLGFDATTIGNHEFNYGLDFLMKSMAGAQFPVVCANVAWSKGADPLKDKTLFKPYAILDRKSSRRCEANAHDQGRSDRLCPAADHEWDRRHLEGNVRPAISSQPPRLRAGNARGRCRHHHCTEPFRHWVAERRRDAWKTPRCRWPCGRHRRGS